MYFDTSGVDRLTNINMSTRKRVCGGQGGRYPRPERRAGDRETLFQKRFQGTWRVVRRPILSRQREKGPSTPTTGTFPEDWQRAINTYLRSDGFFVRGQDPVLKAT